MWVSQYFISFVIISFMGWIYETIYSLLRKGKWENRGFLYGPICPIYGIGAICLIVVYHALVESRLRTFVWWEVFLVSFFGSIVLEYITSWGLEKLFHALWWDYSEVPLNIHGRVCLPASLGFGIAGLLVVYFIDPFVSRITGMIPPIWMEVLGLLLSGVLAMDFTLTISALTNFEKTILQLNEKINSHMDSFVESMKEKKQLVESSITEERERFTKENIKQVFQHGSVWSKHALHKIKRYRHPKIEADRMEQIIKEVRKFLKRK